MRNFKENIAELSNWQVRLIQIAGAIISYLPMFIYGVNVESAMFWLVIEPIIFLTLALAFSFVSKDYVYYPNPKFLFATLALLLVTVIMISIMNPIYYALLLISLFLLMLVFDYLNYRGFVL